MKKITVIKLFIFLVIMVTLSSIKEAVEPLLTADLSIHAQLADSNTTRASYDIYRQLLNYHWVLYLIIGVLMFHKEIKSIFKEEKKDEKDS